jgi:molybdenum cofactor biosynthesis protein B
LTVSDTRTIATDRSGQLLHHLLEQAHHTVAAYEICPDDPDRIRDHLQQWGQHPAIDVVISSGGTGIAPRDTTYEAIATLLHPTLPGFGELFRMLSFDEIGARAMASRAIAGVHQNTWVFALPGSSNGVRLAMERLILPELTHLLTQLRPDFPAAPTVPPP